MLNYIFEVGVNVFQLLMFMGFLYLFFERKYKGLKNILLFIVFFAANFVVMHIFTFYIPPVVGLDIIIPTLVFEAFVFVCLKGNRILRPIMPVVAMLINTVITWSFLYLTMFFTGRTLAGIATQSSLARYVCVILVNLTNLAVFVILLRFRNSKYNLQGTSNIIVFIGIPVLAMIIIYSVVYVYIITDYRTDIFSYVFISCFSMIAITAVVWYMISRISRDNNIKTELQLTELRADMYKTDILNSNLQIEKMSKIKHDFKNNIAVLNNLVTNHSYEEARKLCENMLENISLVYTPVHTDNPVLNAVINVELEKANSYDIDFKVELNTILSELRDSDLIAIIGNVCDNAIEYLKACPKDIRKMSLSIKQHNDYAVITCKNCINGSVLDQNPKLKTVKKDENNHGKGISIIKDAAERYNGSVEFKETDGFFVVTALLEISNLPKNE